MNEWIDLRSDTVTRPTSEMKKAMFNAKVGDDVFRDDPTVNALEEKAAKLFGHEAALYVASGTMANQIAIKVHTQPGDEVVCDKLAHIYNYEGGGIAYNSGCSVRLLDGDRGRFTVEQVQAAVNPDDEHFPVTSLVAAENTCNKGAGSIWEFAELQKVSTFCRKENLRFHLDGARVFNALIETETQPSDLGALFDSISFCLSKGLGAPVGSVLVGSESFIKKARRIRKVMGGGMRQAGYLAAAGIYALDHHVERLCEDHRRAKALAETLSSCSFVDEILPVSTNIVIFKMTPGKTTLWLSEHMHENGILTVDINESTMRFVTHLDFTDDMLEKTVHVLKSLS